LDSAGSVGIRRDLFSSVESGIARGLERLAEGVSGLGSANRIGFETVQPGRLFAGRDHSAALCYGGTLYGSTVLVVDPRGLQKDVNHWLANSSLRSQTLGTLSRAAQVIEAGVQQVGLVVIDLDSCGGIASIAPDLIAFRLKFVDTPVVLISAESQVDDFSVERLAIGDVTLRAPVSVSRLDLALAEAQINNQVWQSRNTAPLQ
jgi:hypothetical protein